MMNDDFLNEALNQQFGDLHFKVCPKTGMKAIIAIHSTKRGPALGGCRFIEYPNTLSAIQDAMRLAQGMSYKSALAGLALGGGKAVIIKPTEPFNRTELMHQFGSFVQEIGGRYITALDSGTELSDMDVIAQHTPYIASLSQEDGDPAPSTAMGVFLGIQAAVAFKLGKQSLEGIHIVIQGLGHVGSILCKMLHECGAKLTVTDINPQLVANMVDEYGAHSVPTDKVYDIPCDVFAPCALGAGLNDTTIPKLQTSIIAGAANNQLAKSHHGQQLHQKGILFAPDYVINAGGVIFAASKYLKTSATLMHQQLQNIQTSLHHISERSAVENRPCHEIANEIAKNLVHS